jgi:hypothetical protein
VRLGSKGLAIRTSLRFADGRVATTIPQCRYEKSHPAATWDRRLSQGLRVPWLTSLAARHTTMIAALTVLVTAQGGSMFCDADGEYRSIGAGPSIRMPVRDLHLHVHRRRRSTAWIAACCGSGSAGSVEHRHAVQKLRTRPAASSAWYSGAFAKRNTSDPTTCAYSTEGRYQRDPPSKGRRPVLTAGGVRSPESAAKLRDSIPAELAVEEERHAIGPFTAIPRSLRGWLEDDGLGIADDSYFAALIELLAGRSIALLKSARAADFQTEMFPPLLPAEAHVEGSPRPCLLRPQTRLPPRAVPA